MLIRKIIFYITLILGVIIPGTIFASTIVTPGHIDPLHSTSWLCTGEPGNTDCHDHTLINWRPSATASSSPVVITDTGMSGWIWSENFGWIRLAPDSSSSTWTGVSNNTSGNLGGYGWGIAGSWINFHPTNATSVHIDPTNGQFNGYAFAQNFGWMYFDCNDTSASSCLMTDWRHDTSGSTGSTSTTACAISLFAAASSTISYGSSTTLNWSATDCTGVTLTTTNASSTSSNSYSSSTTSLDVGPLYLTTTYSLVGNSSATDTSPLSVIVTVNPLPIPLPEIPTATPPAGTYTSTQSVTLASVGADSIHYTTDGTAASCTTGTVFASSTPILVSSSMVINAVGCNVSGSTSNSFSYFINYPPADPVATPPAGTYTSTQSITLSSVGAISIHYTVDNTNPTCSTGETFSSSSPISVVSSTIIKAVGCGMGGTQSGVSIFGYVIGSTTSFTCSDPLATNFGASTACTYNVITGTTTATTTATTTIATTTIATIIQDIIPTATSVQVVVNNVTKSIISPAGIAVTTTVAATGAAVSTSVSVATGIFLSPFSFADILLIPLRLWSFLMGLLGIGKKKKPWGTVFDSVTKQPLDPAYVLLRNMEGKDIATAITDLDGRYGFVIPEPGNYFLVANKTNYIFPSQKLVGQDHDELYDELYFGEHFSVTKKGELIAKNIPMDPEKFDWNEFAKRSQHLMKFYSRKQKWVSFASNFFFWIGFIVSSVVVLMSMTKLNIAMFCMYAVLFFARHFVFKAKPFGVVSSLQTKQPIPFAIVRVSQQVTGVEVIHRVADMIGKYYCLLPNGDYFVRIDQKQDDGTYKTIAEKIPTKVTKGYLSENFTL